MNSLGRHPPSIRPWPVELSMSWLPTALYLAATATGKLDIAEMRCRPRTHIQGLSALPWPHKPCWSRHLLYYQLESLATSCRNYWHRKPGARLRICQVQLVGSMAVGCSPWCIACGEACKPHKACSYLELETSNQLQLGTYSNQDAPTMSSISASPQ